MSPDQEPPADNGAEVVGTRDFKLVKTLIIVALTGALAYALVSYVGGRDVLDALRKMSVIEWLSAFAIVAAIPIIPTFRLRVVMRGLDIDIPWRRAYSVLMGIYPFNVFAPAMAGDLLRVTGLRDHAPAMLTAGALLVERLLDVAVLSVFAAVGGMMFGRPEIALVAVAGLSGVITALILARRADRLPLGRKARKRLAELSVAVDKLIKKPRTLAAAVLATLVHWQVNMALAAILFYGVGIDAPYGFIVAAMPVAIFVGLVPVTLGGMGTRDAAMVVLFASYAEPSQIMAAGLLYSLFTYWVLGVLGLPFARRALGS